MAKRRYKHEPGEYMPIGYENDPDSFYVHGHIDPAKAREIIERETDGFYQFSDPIPKYGRCSQRADLDWDHMFGWMLETYTQPGRGRFPIMEADYLGRGRCEG